MIKGGLLGAEPATTMWELWNSDQEGPGMNSRNHIMFGTVSSFLHKARPARAQPALSCGHPACRSAD